MPFFSIIIPVYNSGKTIIPLLESIKMQKYSDYEIIVVNDGSSDDSERIINNYQKNFENLRYIYQENSGVSVTRNTGLYYAKGKYILFADADDFFECNAFEKLHDTIISNNGNLVCFNYFNYYDHQAKESALNLENTCMVIDKEEAILNFLNYCYINKFASAVWNKVYKREIIEKNNISFKKNLKIGEDLLFNIEYFCNVQTITIIQDCLYNYYQSENSIMRSFRKDNISSIKAYVPEMITIIKKNDCTKLMPYIYDFYVSNFWGVVNNELKNPSYKEGKRNIEDYCKYLDHNCNLSYKKCTSLKVKIYYFLITTKLWYIIYKFKYIASYKKGKK